MPTPDEIIRDAIHSAFVKYPREDDPDWSHNWIKQEDSSHLAKLVLLELRSNGYEIVKKAS